VQNNRVQYNINRNMNQEYAVRNDADFPEHPKTKESADPALRMSNGEQQGHSIKQSHPCVANTGTVTCELAAERVRTASRSSPRHAST
jgi:hypothetical protein